MSVPAEVGQTWASNRPQDIAANHNQARRVLGIATRPRWIRANGAYDEVPVAVLTCDGNGGTMQSRVSLRPDGSITGHRLVAEADSQLTYLAEQLRGIKTRPRWNRYQTAVEEHDLADEVMAALLWPRLPDGSQNPRIEVVLHQDALIAITRRIAELVQVIEQSAMAMHVGVLDSEPESE